MTQNKDRTEVTISPVPILHPLSEVDVAEVDVVNRTCVNEVKIDMEDIQEEVDFWNSAVICYVVGSNPPIQVMEGFIWRIWKNFQVDKVAMVKKGIYI